MRISVKISLNFVPNGSNNNIAALVQIMARPRPGDKPLYRPMMVSFLTHICVTRHLLFNNVEWTHWDDLLCAVKIMHAICPITPSHISSFSDSSLPVCWTAKHPKNYVHGFRFVVFCCGLLQTDFTHIIQGGSYRIIASVSRKQLWKTRVDCLMNHELITQPQ